MENGLPLEWCIIWIIISLIFIVLFAKKADKVIKQEKNLTLIFVISFILMTLLTVINLKFGNPLISGNAISTILTSYAPSSFIAIISIIFIKVFTGIGGFSSIGANIFAIAIAGPFIGYNFYKIIVDKFPTYKILAVIFGVIITELTSIVVSCLQLAIAYHYPSIPESFMSYINMYLLNYSQDILVMLALEIVLTTILLIIKPKLEKI